MDRDIIHKAIENPDLLLKSGIADLEKISAQYPYFGAAQMLLTKAYQRANDYRYTDQLHQTAVHTSDRKHLYDWIKKAPAGTIVEALEAEKEHPVSEVIPFSKEIFAEEKSPDTLTEEPETKQPDESVARLVSLMLGDENTREAKEDTTDTLPEEPAKAVQVAPTESPEKIQSEEISEEPVTEAATAPETTTPKPAIKASDFDPVEKEILLEAMQSSIEMEVSEKFEISEEETEKSATEPFVAPDEEIQEANSFAAWVYNRSRQIHFSDKETTAPKEDLPLSISDWQRPSDEEIRTAAQNREAEEAAETAADEDLPEEESRHLSHGIKKIAPSSGRTSQQDLIDRFIRFEPKITPGKALEYTAGNFAKESLEEDFSFVTETMALLFAQQGKLDKARKAFKKLMELHPEKSVYFAAQLKNLDKHKK